MILNVLWNLMAIIGILVFFGIMVIVICMAASPSDRSQEDEDQINYINEYLKRKGEKR